MRNRRKEKKGFTYKSYNFIDKDPVIYEVWGALRDGRVSFASIERSSGVTTQTLRNWFYGDTKRPSHATVRAVLRAAGMDLKIVKTEQPIASPVRMEREDGKRPDWRSRRLSRLPKKRAPRSNEVGASIH